jgi:hypothetical protein
VLAKTSSNLTDRPNELVLGLSPASKNVSEEAEDTVEIRHQATTSETQSKLGRLPTWCSELQRV